MHSVASKVKQGYSGRTQIVGREARLTDAKSATS